MAVPLGGSILNLSWCFTVFHEIVSTVLSWCLLGVWGVFVLVYELVMVSARFFKFQRLGVCDGFVLAFFLVLLSLRLWRNRGDCKVFNGG